MVASTLSGMSTAAGEGLDAVGVERVCILRIARGLSEPRGEEGRVDGKKKKKNRGTGGSDGKQVSSWRPRMGR